MRDDEPQTLIITEGDEYSFARLNARLKFTPVMEEVLLALLVLFVLNLTPKFNSCISFLCVLLERSPNAIGSALQALADLELIAYYRSGRNRVVELQLSHPFLESALVRFFGFKEWHLGKQHPDEQKPVGGSFGFLPCEELFTEFLTFLREEERRIDAQITEYKDWLVWVEETEETIRMPGEGSLPGSTEGEHPLQLFAEEVVSRIQRIEATRVNRLGGQELEEIIMEVLEDYKKVPPWIDVSFLHRQSTIMLDDFLREKFNESRTK